MQSRPVSPKATSPKSPSRLSLSMIWLLVALAVGLSLFAHSVLYGGTIQMPDWCRITERSSAAPRLVSNDPLQRGSWWTPWECVVQVTPGLGPSRMDCEANRVVGAVQYGLGDCGCHCCSRNLSDVPGFMAASSKMMVARNRKAKCTARGRPCIGAYFYTWYSEEKWKREPTAHKPFTYYDSGDMAVLEQHLFQASAAGIDFLLVSFMGLQKTGGAGERTARELRNQRMLIVMERVQKYGMTVALNYESIIALMGLDTAEMEHQFARLGLKEQFMQDMFYVARNLSKHPGFLKVVTPTFGGQQCPVVVIYVLRHAGLQMLPLDFLHMELKRQGLCLHLIADVVFWGHSFEPLPYDIIDTAEERARIDHNPPRGTPNQIKDELTVRVRVKGIGHMRSLPGWAYFNPHIQRKTTRWVKQWAYLSRNFNGITSYNAYTQDIQQYKWHSSDLPRDHQIDRPSAVLQAAETSQAIPGRFFNQDVYKMYLTWQRRAMLANLSFHPNVMPGYDDTKLRGHDRIYIPRDGGRTYRQSWEFARQLVDSAAQMIFITSFNEWHEGTEIEPSTEFPDGLFLSTRSEILQLESELSSDL